MQNNYFDIVQLLLAHPKIDITIALNTTAEKLLIFANSRKQQNPNLISKMQEFIDHQPIKNKISITPEQIAFIMGNQNIYDAIQAYRHQVKTTLNPC